MPIHAQHFVQLATQRVNELKALNDGLQRTYAVHQEKMGELDRARNHALTEFVMLLLPGLVPEQIARVRERTGYGQFEVKNPLERIQEERQQLTQVIATIEGDTRYQNRDELVNPSTGQLIIKADAVRQNYEMMRQATARYESEPNFNELIKNGYETETYPFKFWNYEYYRDWKAGDAICEKLNRDNFPQVRADYEPLRQARDEYWRELSTAQAEIDQVNKLTQLHDESAERLKNLAGLILQDCQRCLREHLMYVDRAQLFAWSAGDKTQEAMVKKLDGIEKKQSYLEQMYHRQNNLEQQQLQAHIQKLNRKIDKFKRPKYHGTYISDLEAQAWLADPREKILVRRQKFWRDYDRVIVFEDYNSYNYAQNMLWWDLMTDGRMDGNFIPEVYEYHRTYPNYSWHHHDYHDAGVSTSSVTSSETFVEVS